MCDNNVLIVTMKVQQEAARSFIMRGLRMCDNNVLIATKEV